MIQKKVTHRKIEVNTIQATPRLVLSRGSIRFVHVSTIIDQDRVHMEKTANTSIFVQSITHLDGKQHTQKRNVDIKEDQRILKNKQEELGGGFQDIQLEKSQIPTLSE